MVFRPLYYFYLSTCIPFHVKITIINLCPFLVSCRTCRPSLEGICRKWLYDVFCCWLCDDRSCCLFYQKFLLPATGIKYSSSFLITGPIVSYITDMQILQIYFKTLIVVLCYHKLKRKNYNCGIKMCVPNKRVLIY